MILMRGPERARLVATAAGARAPTLRAWLVEVLEDMIGDATKPPMRVRAVEAGELEWVRRLNNGAVPAVGVLEPEEVAWLHSNADYFRAVEVDSGQRAGFLIGLLPGRPYGSPNYQWFEERKEAFGYVDRIIAEPAYRGRGIGRLLYDDFATLARGAGMERLVCEVNTRPRNEGSLRFHDRLGFRAVGTAVVGEKEVRMLELPL